MSFDFKFLLVLAFFILNFSLFFNLKSISGIVINLAINFLILIIFLSQIISGESLFFYSCLYLIIFLTLIIFLFLNQKEIVKDYKKTKEKLLSLKFLIGFFILSLVILINISSMSSALIKSLKKNQKENILSLIDESFVVNYQTNNFNDIFQIILIIMLAFSFLASFKAIISFSNITVFKKIK